MQKILERIGLLVLISISVLVGTSWAEDECGWSVTPDGSIAINGNLASRAGDIYAIQQALKANGINACVVLNHGPAPVPLPAGALMPGQNSIIYSLACQGALGPNATAAYLARSFPGTPVVGFQDLVNFGYDSGIPWIGQKSELQLPKPVSQWGVRLIAYDGKTFAVSQLDPAGALPGVALMDVGPNGELRLRVGDESFPVNWKGTTAGRGACGSVPQPRSRIGRIAGPSAQTAAFGCLGIGTAWSQHRELQLALDPNSSVYNDTYHTALRTNYTLREEKLDVLMSSKASWWEKLLASAFVAHSAGCSGRFH